MYPNILSNVYFFGNDNNKRIIQEYNVIYMDSDSNGHGIRDTRVQQSRETAKPSIDV